MAIVWALGCLFCAAWNDFLFKLFKRKKSSMGVLTALIGVVWLLVMLPGWPSYRDVLAGSFRIGMISGIFSIVANLLLIGSMRYQSAGVSSTIYRLNLAAVALGAWLLFDESLNGMQLFGVVIATGAILVFFPWREGSRSSRFGILLALAAALLRAGMALVYKQGLLNGCSEDGILFWNSLCWIGGGVVWYFAAERRLRMWSRRAAGYGLFSGILVFGIVFTMTRALAAGKAGIVIPIAQMSFIVTFLLEGIVFRERPEPMKLAGAFLGICGVLLLSCG